MSTTAKWKVVLGATLLAIVLEAAGLPGFALAAIVAAILWRRKGKAAAARGFTSLAVLAFTFWLVFRLGVGGVTAIIAGLVIAAVVPVVLWYLLDPQQRHPRDAVRGVCRDLPKQVTAVAQESINLFRKGTNP